MRLTGCILLLGTLLGPLRARAALILNEALANEPGSATTFEWVEILNWPDTGQAISLVGYKYIDGGQTAVLSADVLILPGGFAVLARKATGPGSFEERWGDSSGIWGDHESESFPVVAVAQISLRNSSDTLRLVSPSGDTSTILWRSDAGDGISIERIRPGDNDYESNFAPCKDASGSTPAHPNSVLPPQGDLAIDTVIVGPEFPDYGDSIHFAVRIKNVGFGDVASSGIGLSRDHDPDSDADALIPIADRIFNGIREDSETIIVLAWANCPPGRSYLVLSLAGDADTSNNIAKVSLTVRFTHPLIIISEYLANPEPGGPEEWVELANMSGHAIRTEGIRIGDSLNSEPLPGPHLNIPAVGFIILAENASAFRAYYPSFAGTVVQIPGWRALNNSGDGIRLVGPSGEIIDSLSFLTVYDDNRSVERVELTPSFAPPSDWTKSKNPAGATPGAQNSVVRGDPGALVIDSAWIVADALEQGSRDVFASVTNVGFGPTSARDLYIGLSRDPSAPDVVNDTIGTTLIPDLVESQSVIVSYRWAAPAPGIYRVIVWTNNDDGSMTDPPGVAFTTIPFPGPLLIISEYMAAPNSAGPGEWIELYNASEMPLPLGSVRVGDSTGVSTIPPPLTTIEPASFLVIAQDEDQFRDFYQDFSGDVRALTTWHPLGDNGDRIRLLGPTDEVIDSVTYGARSEGSTSIERRQLVPAFADPRDWGECVDPEGATPGRANSIRRLLKDLAIDSLEFDKSEYNAGEILTGTYWVTNVGFDEIADATCSHDYVPSVGYGAKCISFTIGPGETIANTFRWLTLPPGIGTYTIQLGGDDNEENNTLAADVRVRFGRPDLIISEFMANSSAKGPSEWIEIHNNLPNKLNLAGIRVGDSGSVSSPLDFLLLLPDEFCVLAQDEAAFRSRYIGFDGRIVPVSGWKTLNNEGDGIRLVGALGEVIDAINYRNIDLADQSWERTSLASTLSEFDDWSMSVDPTGATPGRPNSLTAASAGSLRIDVAPNPVFRSAGQMARIDYRLEIGESLTLKVFDRSGRPVRTIADNQPSATGYVEWDGTDDDGTALRPGPYILFARSEPSGSTEKKVIVIAP